MEQGDDQMQMGGYVNQKAASVLFVEIKNEEMQQVKQSPVIDFDLDISYGFQISYTKENLEKMKALFWRFMQNDQN